MPEPHPRNCSTCTWFDEELAECHRYPPEPRQATGRVGLYPKVVDVDQVCGEYRLRPAV